MTRRRDTLSKSARYDSRNEHEKNDINETSDAGSIEARDRVRRV
jgi:hypothetical protein